MEKIEHLYQKLSRSGKDEPVRQALEALLASPGDLDLQITVVGTAHRANWLPNRKRALWEAFPVTSRGWAHQCVTRVTVSQDADALCALLSANPLCVLQEVQQRSPDLVLVWDLNGAPSCGLGLAHQVESRLDHYFYVGWKPGGEATVRLDYVESVQPPVGQEVGLLDRNAGACRLGAGFWAELPYGFGPWHGQVSFGLDASFRHYFGYTGAMRRQLGYEAGSGAA